MANRTTSRSWSTDPHPGSGEFNAIVEISDYECPFVSVQSTLEQIEHNKVATSALYSSTIRSPSISAEPAARAVLAQRQGGFWAYHAHEEAGDLSDRQLEALALETDSISSGSEPTSPTRRWRRKWPGKELARSRGHEELRGSSSTGEGCEEPSRSVNFAPDRGGAADAKRLRRAA